MKAPLLHPEALPRPQLELLKASAGPTQRWQAYLAGGAALALHLGHRQSVDLDWFTPRTLRTDELAEDVRRLGTPVTIQQNTEGTFLGAVAGVKVSVFRYRFPLLNAPVSIDGCNVASIADLAAMKLLAVSQRAAKRDYVDVYAMLDSRRVTLPQMLEAFKAKYPTGDVQAALRALAYHKDVDREPMPVMRAALTWAQVKAGLTKAIDRHDPSR